MSSWVPLAPSKAGGPSNGPKGSTARIAAVLKPSKPPLRGRLPVGPYIGRWPESVLLRILHHIPVPDLPQVARCSRSLAQLVRDEAIWKHKYEVLGLSVNEVTQLSPPQTPGSNEDDFGDFSSDPNEKFEDVDFGDFHGQRTNDTPNQDRLIDFQELPLPSRPTGTNTSRPTGFFALIPVHNQYQPTNGRYYKTYKAHHLSLLSLCRLIRSSPSPSSTLSLLFPASNAPPPSLSDQADRLLTLLLFLSPQIQPLSDWGFLRQALLTAADRFDSTCLVAFETADARGDVAGMQIAASSSWKVWDAGEGGQDQWECGRVWVEKRELFYETGRWDSLENIVKGQNTSGVTVRQLDFTPMDAFMTHVLEAFHIDAERAMSIFPAGARVVLSFCDRVANDVIGEYIQPLLAQCRIVSQDLFLQATAATFVQAWKLAELVKSLESNISRANVEDVIYRMFESNMDEYLDEETEWIKRILEGICTQWQEQLGTVDDQTSMRKMAPTFLASSNPDQVKRNVLAGFKDVLLLPVTIVPRTVSYGVNAIVAGGSNAVSGLAMLNPQRWAASEHRQIGSPDGGIDEVVFEVPKEEMEGPSSLSVPSHPTPLAPSTRAATPVKSFDRLQLLVSLDTALELIHADRESLKRAETFADYPGKYGRRVREAIEEIFVLMLKVAGDKHIAPGFRVASSQMSTYKPGEHEETTSVAPLLQFFELVHVGDTIQSMVQVYFDKDLAKYVDKTDFLNGVMREKKRFESILDDAVAAGLNEGIQVLMNQVEHIIQVKTGPREYYPVEGATLELGPTEGCREAIACLEMHCDLLRGSTTKEVLEVFYQEVGIRLQAILQRHLKRQIISLEGGFQIIADLNAYHGFIASLKQQRITDDFANLKMLGHVYIVSDAKDLAQIVKDVSQYGGTFRPEDIYEFIQRRSDWKKIEKTVDKAMYSLSMRDDCVVM